MWHKLGGIEKFITALMAADVQLAAHEHRQGCRCGGRLHRADYPRKARGVPKQWERLFRRRFSFCCAEQECRRRRTPPSVRFFGRRLYVAAVVVACSAGWVTPEEAGVPRRTVRRWRQSFRQEFVRSVFWQSARARVMPPVVEAELPASLLERFRGDDAMKLYLTLEFLAPITTDSTSNSMDG